MKSRFEIPFPGFVIGLDHILKIQHVRHLTTIAKYKSTKHYSNTLSCLLLQKPGYASAVWTM